MKKIMVVDDHKDIVETLSLIVKKQGHKVASAENGDEFVANVEKEKPDLVLLDVMMPGLTTKQILNKLVEKGLKDLKIVLVTVVRFSVEEIASLKKGFNVVDYISKPFDVKDIISVLKKHVK